MLVVLVVGQLPGADRGVKRVRVWDEVRVSQVRGQVVCGGEGWRVGGRVALWRLRGHYHPADPCGILQNLQERREKKGRGVRGIKDILLEFHSKHYTWKFCTLTAPNGSETYFSTHKSTQSVIAL